jgi:hypothetical protein
VSALGFANGFPGAWYDHVGAADVDLQRQWPPAGRRAADDTGELGLVPSEDEDSRTRAGQHRCRPARAKRRDQDRGLWHRHRAIGLVQPVVGGGEQRAPAAGRSGQ